ncbi:DUF1819 family protein [Halomonas sp. BLK-85]
MTASFSYNSDLIGGNLMVRESRFIAALLLEKTDDAGWQQAIMVDNCLQKNRPATAKRMAQSAASQTFGAAQTSTEQAGEKAGQPRPSAHGAANRGSQTAPQGIQEAPPVSAPRPVARVSVSEVLNRVHEGVYLESQADVDAFLTALKDELDDAVQAGKRVQVR